MGDIGHSNRLWTERTLPTCRGGDNPPCPRLFAAVGKSQEHYSHGDGDSTMPVIKRKHGPCHGVDRLTPARGTLGVVTLLPIRTFFAPQRFGLPNRHCRLRILILAYSLAGACTIGVLSSRQRLRGSRRITIQRTAISR